MKQTGYGEYIVRIVRNMPYEAAIQTGEIARQLAERLDLPFDRAKTLTNVKLKRMADRGEIERLQKGLYCHVKQTVLGKVTPGIDQVLAKILTLQNGARIGYESGASLRNRLGLSTLIPRDIEITTNRYGVKLPESCHIKLRKPSATVTDGNWRYLQFIDLFIGMPDAHTDVENSEQRLRQYAKSQNLDSLALIFTARRHYRQKVIPLLIDLLWRWNMKPQQDSKISTSGKPADKAYLEAGLPESLQKAIADYLQGEQAQVLHLDCLWGELYGSINANLWSGCITEEQAAYLRGKYLYDETETDADD